MRLTIKSGIFVLAMSLGAAAEPVEGVIQRQLDAFLRDDFATAFTFASPGIRRMFGTAENFGVMVRRGYPMVWRPAEVRYMRREMRGEKAFQQVLVTDQDGGQHMLEYEMVPDGDSWKINGVRILEAPQLGA